MIQDLSYNLCESLVENIEGVADVGKKTPPTPIVYLTNWKIVGNSEVHTLPYPDGVVLPNGYRRCKYLEFHGTEHIDTGIIPEQGIGVSVKFKYLEVIGDDGIFGCRTSSYSADSVYCFRQRLNNVLFVSYGGKICDDKTTDNFVINVNDEVELHLDSSSISFTNGTNTFTKRVSTQITKGTKTLYIGYINGYGRQSHILLRTFVLTNGVGNTIFNGIPCLDNNNVPCLYDTVSGTSFYNDGTGTFGYEIEPQPTEIWSCGEYNPIDGKYHILVQPLGGSIADIALTEPLRKVNNVADTIEFPDSSEIVRFASYFNIPFSNINDALRNYDFYDYMSSTNKSGQYIDTGFRIGGTDSVDFRVKFALQNAGGWFGAFDGSDYSSPGFYGTDAGSSENMISLCCGLNNAWHSCAISSEVDSSLYLIKTYAFTKIPSFNGVNGNVLSGEISNATYTPTHNAFIFARNNAGTPSSTRLMSVYSLIVHGKCVFVVAKRKSDNAIGLLNLLDSNPATQLHTNQGRGNDFTLGSQITFEQLCSDIMDGYPDAPTITESKALVTIRVEESGGELLPSDTPITELVDAPQIEEAEGYTCVISQGGKAVEWSSFETE